MVSLAGVTPGHRLVTVSLCPVPQCPALAPWALSRALIELSGTSCTINILQDGLRVWIDSVPQTGARWVGFIMWL